MRLWWWMMVGRQTVKQQVVHEALRQRGVFSSAQDVHAALRAAGHQVGLATVYRHLQTFAQQGRVDAVRSDDGEMLYRWCGDGATGRHHHHLVCRRCGRAEEIEAPEVERWAESTAARFGFTGVDHTVELAGTCPACAGAE